mmetsp:Transcript_64534/g.185552  ORF Transcript_64534/g.185552 Transcript_64534/m.185552 type:complete len:206 (+) Transcript_64534:390-1007(+)
MGQQEAKSADHRRQGADRGRRADGEAGEREPAPLHPQRRGQFLLGRHQRRLRRRDVHSLGKRVAAVGRRLRVHLQRARVGWAAMDGRAGQSRLRRLHVHKGLGPGHRIHLGRNWPVVDAGAVLEHEGPLQRLLGGLLVRRQQRERRVRPPRSAEPQHVFGEEQPSRPDVRQRHRPRLRLGLYDVVHEVVAGPARLDAEALGESHR